VTIYTILTGGKLPYTVNKPGQVTDTYYHPIADQPKMSNVLKKMVTIDPLQRMTAAEAWRAWKAL